MSTGQLHSIQQVFELQFRKKQGAFLAVVQQETKLRLQLEKLQSQLRSSQNEKHEDMQAIGADLIWQSWVEGSKKSLNLELAQVLAQKETLLANVKKDYGKLLVSKELHRKAASDESNQSRAELLKNTLEIALLQSRH